MTWRPEGAIICFAIALFYDNMLEWESFLVLYIEKLLYYAARIDLSGFLLDTYPKMRYNWTVAGDGGGNTARHVI